MRYKSATLRKPKAAPGRALERKHLGNRFRDARLVCGLSVDAAAKLLRVTHRTIQNWESGRAAPPYSAYKLMRILRGYELPGNAWKGFRVVGDTLWSPEHLAFKASDHYWWSLTCRMAEQFRHIVRGRRIAFDFMTEVASTGPGGIPYRPDSAPVASQRRQSGATEGNFSAVRASTGPQGPSSNTGHKSLPELAQKSGGAR